MKIAIVNSMYHPDMGYLENCLPGAFARLGHDVHVVVSNWNPYANEDLYDATYAPFLGPKTVPPATTAKDGFTLHRLKARLLDGYVFMPSVRRVVDQLQPDIVYSCGEASLESFTMVLGRTHLPFKYFCGSHQTASVLKPYLTERGHYWRKLGYWLTRTLPSMLASRHAERVYAQTPDCLEIAARFYGVPREKLVLRSLCTDIDAFFPAATDEQVQSRRALRATLGVGDDDVLCLYSGRFTNDKNPLVLARAIDSLATTSPRFKALFIGAGEQEDAIRACRHCIVEPFKLYRELPALYRAADLGVWPRQESMSMLDAAAAGLPLIVSDRIGERARVEGNGKLYVQDSVASMAERLESFASPAERLHYGSVGRQRMVEQFSLMSFARQLETDFIAALKG